MSDAHIFELIGLIYIATGVGALLQPGFFRKMLEDFANSYALVYAMGFIVLTAGYFLARFHNFWMWDTGVIITIIGWIALIKGFTMIAFPAAYRNLSIAMKNKPKLLRVQSFVVLGLGILFMALGVYYDCWVK